MLAPIFTFALSLFGWCLMPFGENLVICDISLGVILLFAISSLNVYGVILAGWASIQNMLF